jgi:FkbM family methyltransferase
MSETAPVVISSEVLDQFEPWHGTVPAGYFAYFMGNITRADYWAFTPEVRALYDKERVEWFSRPSVDDNTMDWLIMLEGVVAAQDRFTMVALGAGWGRWLVGGAKAAEQKGLPYHLIGVEAEPTHYRWMVEHFRDNGIDPQQHELLEAAASDSNGEAWFFFGKSDSWYGQSIITDADMSRAGQQRGGVQTYEGETAMRVRTLDLVEITKNVETVDYMHMDIQGAEYNVLSAHPEVLQAKVKRVLIGTHSHEIEQNLRNMFQGLGWVLQYDVPMDGYIMVDGKVVEVGDGAQSWINPALAGR